MRGVGAYCDECCRNAKTLHAKRLPESVDLRRRTLRLATNLLARMPGPLLLLVFERCVWAVWRNGLLELIHKRWLAVISEPFALVLSGGARASFNA